MKGGRWEEDRGKKKERGKEKERRKVGREGEREEGRCLVQQGK